MSEKSQEVSGSEKAKKRFSFNPKRWRERGGKLFWAWIAYQSIKGMITLSLIWIPLLMLWLQR